MTYFEFSLGRRVTRSLSQKMKKGKETIIMTSLIHLMISTATVCGCFLKLKIFKQPFRVIPKTHSDCRLLTHSNMYGK